MTRFERATPSSQAKCATKLRYIPTSYISDEVHENLILNKVKNQVFSNLLLYNNFAMSTQIQNRTETHTVAGRLVNTLVELGVDSVFGYPGASVLSIYNELSFHLDSIKYNNGHHSKMVCY